MKKCLFFIIFSSFFSCSKEGVRVPAEQETAALPYDTAAIDSFSAGATSADVARRIKISSLKYQDSVKQVSMKLEEERLLNKAKEEKEKAAKTLAEEKKKPEGEKAKNEKQNLKAGNQPSETEFQPSL